MGKRSKKDNEYKEANSISLQRKTWKVLSKISDNTNLSVSIIVGRAIREYLDSHRKLLKKAEDGEDVIDELL